MGADKDHSRNHHFKVLPIAMLYVVVFVLALLNLGTARVTFPHSEVLQAPDLDDRNKANFKCANICKVFADRKYNNLVITQNGNIIANFNTVVSGNAAAPTGVVLPAGDNYVLENRGEINPQFVFYIVDTTVPNYGASVYAPQQTQGIAIKDTSRYVTILSSFDAIEFSGFTGAFPAGYPRIYATGMDAAGNDQCHAVYQARSQRAAELSWPVIPSAVLTIDFGFVGSHNVSVNQVKASDPPMAAGMTVVYTSPGYIGCSFTSNQNYYSSVTRLADAFTILADSFDINGVYYAIATTEVIHLNVNNNKIDFAGTSTYTKHFTDKPFAVALSWVRQTPTSSFAFQLDFGTSSDPNNNNAETTTKTTKTDSGTSSDPNSNAETTTKTGRSLSVLSSIVFVIAAWAW